MNDQEARDISGYRAILVQKARAHADEMRRYDDTEDLVSTLVEMANLLIEDASDRKHPEPEENEPVGFYVIPKRDAPDQDSLWDGTLHPTCEAAQASLDSAVAEWGQDAHSYRIVAMVPVGEVTP